MPTFFSTGCRRFNILFSIVFWYLLQESEISIPKWELETGFNPIAAAQEVKSPTLVDWYGNPFHRPLPYSFNPLVESWPGQGDDWESVLRNIHFWDCDSFIAGGLHSQEENWDLLLNFVNNEQSDMVRDWINNMIDVKQFMIPFKGNFKGSHYDAKEPPHVIMSNYESCEPHKFEIAHHLEERLRNGSIELIGKVGEVQPPHLVMPLIMVEGVRKNRLCHDERLLNLFMNHIPFSLETLSVIPNILSKGDLMAASDEKSAYDGLMLAPSSRTYFGLQFGGWYMQYKTIPFGWKMSPFIYQTIGMQVTEFLRLKGVITTQYLDDRFLGPMIHPMIKDRTQNTGWSIVFNAAILNVLGYTVERYKSVWCPTLQLRHLGLMIFSDIGQFGIPENKKDSFKLLRENILSQKQVPLQCLQKIMGKCMSFCLVYPAAKLYIRNMARAVAATQKCSKFVKISGELREEIEFWGFIDSMQGGAAWRQERHVDLEIATDASGYAWGASLADKSILHDRFEAEDKRPIHLKESEALIKTLHAIPDVVRDKRLDVHVDNQAVVKAWERLGARDKALNDLIKELFQLVTHLNCDMKLIYIKSADNPADEPSRRLSLADAMLSPTQWSFLEQKFGPHTFDMMSLDSNAMKDKNGHVLPHYTPWPLPDSSGVNVLSQVLSDTENYYCFPPFCMVDAVIGFLLNECKRPLRVTLVLPKLYPTQPWWPRLKSSATVFTLASVGDQKTILAPSTNGYTPVALKQSLLVARLVLL